MSKYRFDAHGGPLFLKLLLELVTTSSEGNLRALEMILETYKIKTSCPGEDIEVVVGLFTSVIETIDALRNNELPSDSVRKLLRVFQSTSVAEFNTQFEILEATYVRSSIQDQLSSEFDFTNNEKRLKNDIKSAQYVLAYAERAYRDLLQSGEWDRCLQKTPGKAAFLGKAEQPTEFSDKNSTGNHIGCFNCGSHDHSLRDCPHPRDEERIARNRAKANVNPNPNRTRRGRPHKWRLPEPNEHNKRVVDGKPYTWDPNVGRSGRWVEDTTPSDGQPNGGQPPSHVNITDNTALGNINMATIETALRNLHVRDSTSSSAKDDASTIKTQATDDPFERKLKLTILRKQLDDAIDSCN